MTPFVAVGAVALGLLLGAAYFVGLWWTVARVDRWRRPGRALAVSFVLRAALLLAGVYLLARAGIGPLALGLLGLLLARVALSFVLLPKKGAPPASMSAAAPPERRAPDVPPGGAA